MGETMMTDGVRYFIIDEVNRNKRAPRWGVAPTEVADQPQLFGQVILGAGPGDRYVQAEEIAFRLPPRYVLGKPGSVIMHADELLFIEQCENEKER
jgi:hypothetical protein